MIWRGSGPHFGCFNGTDQSRGTSTIPMASCGDRAVRQEQSQVYGPRHRLYTSTMTGEHSGNGVKRTSESTDKKIKEYTQRLIRVGSLSDEFGLGQMGSD